MRSKLITLVGQLHRHWGDPVLPPTTDPFGLVLWQQVAYLVDDTRRAQAFAMLQKQVGVTPEQVASALPTLLERVARSGGSIAAKSRAERMQHSGQLVMDRWDGDLGHVLAGPVVAARRALKRFPMIGEPGADKILLLTRTHPVLALDSNGLRVLLRIGYGVEEKSYPRTYRSVQEAIAPELPSDFAWLVRAHGLLHHHGQADCTRKTPKCEQCCVRRRCSFAAAGNE